MKRIVTLPIKIHEEIATLYSSKISMKIQFFYIHQKHSSKCKYILKKSRKHSSSSSSTKKIHCDITNTFLCCRYFQKTLNYYISSGEVIFQQFHNGEHILKWWSNNHGQKYMRQALVFM